MNGASATTTAATAGATTPRSPSATSRALAGLDRALEALSDHVNPILVKETRQALKSKQFVVWYLLLLTGSWVVTIGGLAVIGPAAYYGAYGGQLFLWYCAVLWFPLLVVVPFFAFRSLASEQEDNTRDVLTVSALTPYQVVNGKLGGAVLQILLYTSALAPCLAFAYLLRGLDALTLVLLPLIGVLMSVALSLLGILLASLSRARFLQILVSVGFMSGLLLQYASSFTILTELTQYGFRAYQDPEFWWVASGLFLLVATSCLVVYQLAVACNTFTSANRSTPVRVAIVIQQAVFVGWIGGLWMTASRPPEVLFAGFVFAAFYWTLVGMFLTSEAPILSQRVRRTLPESPLARCLFTWFTPGPGTGYVFMLSNLTLLLGLYALSSARSNLTWPAPFPAPLWYRLAPPLILAAYCVAYVGVGRIVILLLRRVGDVSLVGGVLVHALVMLVGGAFPYVLDAFSRRLRRAGFSYLDLPSPFAVFAHAERGDLSELEELTVALVVAGVAACVLLINLALAAAEIRQTRLPLPRRILEDESALNPRAELRPTNPWGDLPTDAEAPGAV